MNVLVYYPNGYQKRVDIKWLYGIDTIEKIETLHPEWNFIYVNDSHKNIYQDIDVILRPNRHDGYPKMIAEANFLNIPYIWSYETGQYVEPSINDIERRLIEIDKLR